MDKLKYEELVSFCEAMGYNGNISFCDNQTGANYEDINLFAVKDLYLSKKFNLIKIVLVPITMENEEDGQETIFDNTGQA